MDVVSISEFLHLTKLSSRDLLTMLENGEVDISVGPLGELLIDLEKMSPETIAGRAHNRKSDSDAADISLLEEMVASELVCHLDEYIDEALELALKWDASRKKEEEEEG